MMNGNEKILHGCTFSKLKISGPPMGSSMKRSSLAGLESMIRRMDKELSGKEHVRELTIPLSRDTIRTCAEAIRTMRSGGRSDRLLEQARRGASGLKKVTARYPELYHSGTVQNALQEMAEAFILIALIKGERIPSPESIDCTPGAYLAGMGDAIGELRRITQDALRKGDLGEAEDCLALMEGLFSALVLFDYPDAIAPVKHKQDVARGLIEKTRGEVAVAARGRQLEIKIAALEKVLAIHRGFPPAALPPRKRAAAPKKGRQ
jgi:translin